MPHAHAGNAPQALQLITAMQRRSGPCLNGGGVGRILDNLKPKALAALLELLIAPPSNDSSSSSSDCDDTSSGSNGSSTSRGSSCSSSSSRSENSSTATATTATATTSITATASTATPGAATSAAAVVAAEFAPSSAACAAANLLALMQAKRRAAPFGLLTQEAQVVVLAAMPLQCRRELLVSCKQEKQLKQQGSRRNAKHRGSYIHAEIYGVLFNH